MIERLQKIMDYAGVSPKKFADILGIQRSSVSHIMSGRNNPSLSVVQKILQNYTNINSDWLLLGVGEMLKSGSDEHGNNQHVTSPTLPDGDDDDMTSDEPVEPKPVSQPAAPSFTLPKQPAPSKQSSRTQTVTPPQPASQQTTQPLPQQTTQTQQQTTPLQQQTTQPQQQTTQTMPTVTVVPQQSIQAMLSNGLIVLDHNTKTFTIYSPGA